MSGTLPIETVLPALRSAVAANANCLLVAQPGAGKTTRVPLALLEDTPPGGRWLLLEPRRVAARLAAAFLADQLGESVGNTVGYRVRGDSKTSSQTRLEVVTQGILIRMLQDDPTLSDVTGVIFDEFHERSLDADLGLTLMIEAQQVLREDLKILIMSATLDTRALLDLLGPETPLIECPGRQWPVTTFYRNASLQTPPVTHQANVIIEALAAHDGDILVFLPGQREIRELHNALASRLAEGIEVSPLYGQLPLAQQQEVLSASRQSCRRIILSTAIAESSVTVPGVRIVVDSGRERVPIYQPRSGLTRLTTRLVNRASADQRRGRAGREAAGFCYRLWSEETVLASHREPEIQQSDLAGLVFELARWGAGDPGSLSWVTPPPPGAFRSSQEQLQMLELLQHQDASQLTPLGRQCARWPTHPRLARLLEFADKQDSLDCKGIACWLLSWLEERPESSEPDALGALEAMIKAGQSAGHRQRRLEQTARQWAQRLRISLPQPNMTTMQSVAPMLLLQAYPDRIALSQGEGRYKLFSGGQASLPQQHPLSQSLLLLALELDGQPSNARIFSAVSLPEATLAHQYPESMHWVPQAFWDESAERLVANECRRLRLGHRELTLATRPGTVSVSSLPADTVANALLQGLRRRGFLRWSDADRQLLGRLRLLHNTVGDPWPEVEETLLLESLEQWLAPHVVGLHRLDQVDRLPLGKILLESLDWSLQDALNKLTPTHIKVPSGSNISIDYSGDEPILAVKLQEMFGQGETPAIVAGRVPLLVHLLSPARRPVQVTRDLAGFWQTSYFDVRKDLRGRYPKHPWPEDPASAVATAKTKPRQ